MWAGQEQKRVDACDVVVVGAGLVGAAVAARLAREGFDTAVLEAQRVAGGATGRSAGMVLTGLAGHYNRAVSDYGRQKAQEVWALTVEGRERLVEAAERLEVPVERTGSLALAVEDAEVEALRESAELLGEDGFDAWFGTSDPLGRGFHAAMRQPDDVTVNAAALTQALLITSVVAVHEGTEVYHLESENGGVRVWAQGRTVLCSRVVLAVNGYAPLFDPYFNDKVAHTRSLVFATEPLDETLLEQPCYADYGREYCCQLPDRRLLLGGWRRPRGSSQEATPKAEPDDMGQDGLIRFASRHFPEVKTHSADRWSGTMGFTPDSLPLLGRLPDLPQVYFAVGFGGRGLAWAFFVAERLVALMLHETDPGLLSAARLG
ncbi:MAG: FAD-dependent oxidoreductase [Chloroflexota bacterium]|nr:FAD-dependent oxidoreductase [Chloroflexota bacterium]